jgi:hypothetical protein
MVSLKLSVLFTVAAVVAFASSAVSSPTYFAPRENVREEDKNQISTPDSTDGEDEDENTPIYTPDFSGSIYPEMCIFKRDSEFVIDEIPVKYLTVHEITELLDEEDDIFAKELDIFMASKIVRTRIDDFGGVRVPTVGRHKRWVPVAARLLFAGRALFKGAVRAPKPTASGSRITQQYTRSGNFQNANQHFNSFRPDNVKPLSKNGISGRTGTVGKHRITVRDGSKQGSPTLEIRSPKSNVEYVRKFRYEQQGKH